MGDQYNQPNVSASKSLYSVSFKIPINRKKKKKDEEEEEEIQ